MDRTEKYSDILHAQRPPVPAEHPRMSILNRAKLFSPFAALRGYDEEIERQVEKQHWVQRSELSQEDREEIGRRLGQLKKKDPVTVTYFVPASSDELLHDMSLDGTAFPGFCRADGQTAEALMGDRHVYDSDERGIYRTISGVLIALDPVAHTLRVGGEAVRYESDGLARERFTEIRFEDIIDLI